MGNFNASLGKDASDREAIRRFDFGFTWLERRLLIPFPCDCLSRVLSIRNRQKQGLDLKIFQSFQILKGEGYNW